MDGGRGEEVMETWRRKLNRHGVRDLAVSDGDDCRIYVLVCQGGILRCELECGQTSFSPRIYPTGTMSQIFTDESATYLCHNTSGPIFCPEVSSPVDLGGKNMYSIFRSGEYRL